jgi:hypothetical protein
MTILRLTVLLLAFLQATAAAAAVPALQDVLLALPAGVYNPSLVVYQGSAWLVARSTQLKWDNTGMKWILNKAHLCELKTTDWSVIRRVKYTALSVCFVVMYSEEVACMCSGFDPLGSS